VTGDSSRAVWLRQEVLAIAEKWPPYRSLATSYLFSAAFEPAEAPPARRRSA